MKENRILSFALITLAYIGALAIGITVFNNLATQPIYLRVLLADISATVFIYIISVLLNNASVYDPYWSVAPIAIVVLLAIHLASFSAGVILVLAAITYWGIRLTLNWAYNFTSFNYQDWRYVMLKEKSKKLYPIVNFLGIHLFPTIIVYLALLPAILFIESTTQVVNVITLIGFLFCLIAATVQMISDLQMHKFKNSNSEKSKYIQTGLWRYSRHPNYFGEILFWFGIFLITIPSLLTKWYLVVGPVSVLLMFVFISIPMAEKRLLSYKENFTEYQENVRMLLPFKK
ncbi:MAG: DUF1295 domain-containing protein [Bacilli bacterium]|nr:DUF1295 domain-containing protein [Bacilli bacterium]